MGSKTHTRQVLFAAEYCKDLNGKQAAIRAGYSPRTAEAQASHLLRNRKVQEAIAEHRDKVSAKSIASLEECCQRLTEIIRANIEDFELGEDGRIVAKQGNTGALQEVVLDDLGEGRKRAKIKLRDPVAAMNRLAAFLGLDKPRQFELDVKAEITVPDTLKGLD